MDERGRLPSVASILMLVVGLFTVSFVDETAGVALIALGASMYLFHLWYTRRLRKAFTQEQ